ncbi:transglycosylase SLT domain-containing protein [Candidatus Falkowbacteria bacterium]|nr:transglycosylase SLT domain-containing protein [Candidatus Falkowbacteria bacterium]
MRSFYQKSRTQVTVAMQWIEDVTNIHPVGLAQLLAFIWAAVLLIGLGYSINLEETKKLKAEHAMQNSSKHYYSGFAEKVHAFKVIHYDSKISLVQKSNKLTRRIQSFVTYASQRNQVSQLEVKATISIESGFDCQKKNPISRAFGCMQIIPSQHKVRIEESALICKTQFNENIKLIWGPNRLIRNDCVNILTGVAFYRELLDRYNNRLFAYLAYYIGSARVDTILKDAQASNIDGKSKNFLDVYSIAPSDHKIVLDLCKSKSYMKKNTQSCVNAEKERQRSGIRKNDFLYHVLSFVALSRPDIDLTLFHDPMYELELVPEQIQQPSNLQMIWAVVRNIFS